VDESGFYLLPLVSRTWAPKGQTPIIEEKAGREHLSLIAAMAPNGQLYVSGQDKAFDSEGIVGFLEYLCRRYRKKDIVVIWDGATIHRSQAVKEFLACKKGRIHLVALPSYSPEWSATAAEPRRVVMEPIKKGIEKYGVHQLDRSGRSVKREN
jgi:hypothetical protein